MSIMGYNIAFIIWKKENNELQSRREFFKKAAKSTLPILGAVILASNPIISKASEECLAYCEHCNSNCTNGCRTGCQRGCGNSCHTNCQGHTHKYHSSSDCDTCKYYCAGCTGECRGTCSGSCNGSSYTVS